MQGWEERRKRERLSNKTKGDVESKTTKTHKGGKGKREKIGGEGGGDKKKGGGRL